MPYTDKADSYSKDEYTAAKQTNIVAFLNSIGYGLTKSGSCYKGKIHDSLVIHEDGRWYWNSRELHGASPIELYKHILLNDYGFTDEISAAISAVKQLAGGRGLCMTPPVESKQPPETEPGLFRLPAPYRNNRRVIDYLCKRRGLDQDIVLSLIKSGQIYETIQTWNVDKTQYEDGPFNNAVFVSYDKYGNPRGAFIRGTISSTERPYKRDLEFSDKSYPFTLPGQANSDRVFAFESAIDSISHASICKMRGGDWRGDYRISLGGTSFIGLKRFLQDHPDVTGIVACLDNDDTGNRRSRKLMEEYAAKGYKTYRQAPENKDFNDDLLNNSYEEELEL